MRRRWWQRLTHLRRGVTVDEYYILNDAHQPVESTEKEWGAWRAGLLAHRAKPWESDDFLPNEADWRVGKTATKQAIVSTEFVGLNQAHDGGPPVLFETLVFQGKLTKQAERYSTWDEAERGHAEVVKRVRETEED
jgi:hypothetical protein